MDYKAAVNFIVDRRRDDLAAADAFFKRALARDPEFRAAELALRSAELDWARGKRPQAEVDELRRVRDAIVDKRGYRDKITPPPHCPVCGDTGRTKDGFCRCVKKLAIESRSDNVEFPLRSFDEIDYSLFAPDAKTFVEKTAANLKAIADKGASAKRKNVNLIGGSGTGKTFLAACFAGESEAVGRTVVFVTAFTFLNRALSYHTSFDQGRADMLTPLLDCDVLIIDDLGTESVLKNVTAEYLYLVVNQRQLRGLTTVITSNLSVDGIAARYGERIASRLFDRKLCYTAEFDFADIRKIKIGY